MTAPHILQKLQRDLYTDNDSLLVMPRWIEQACNGLAFMHCGLKSKPIACQSEWCCAFYSVLIRRNKSLWDSLFSLKTSYKNTKLQGACELKYCNYRNQYTAVSACNMYTVQGTSSWKSPRVMFWLQTGKSLFCTWNQDVTSCAVHKHNNAIRQ